MKILKSTESGQLVEELQKVPVNDSFNRNVLIVGTSGSGKSYLSAVLRQERKPKITMIFKEDQTYASEKILKISDTRVPTEKDRSSFLTSFQEALDLNQMGIMGSSVPSVLSKYYAPATEMKRKLKSAISRNKGISGEVEKFILNQMELYYPERGGRMLEDLSNRIRKTVISLDSMSQQEQIYFADYILRILKNSISDDGLLIDEIHRLKNLNGTIISEIVREIRHRGYIMAVTQSLSDLPEALINNFGTIFHFNSIHFSDLQKLAILDPELPRTIMHLKQRQFIEVRRFPEEWKKKFKYIYEAVEDEA